MEKPELVVKRTVAAPRELVFAAFTDPEHIDLWWGPNGYRTITASMDVVVGGQWCYTMEGPDGTVYPNLVTYTEIAPPARLCYDLGEPGDPQQFKSTVTFDQIGGGTEITLRMLCRSVEQYEAMKKFGAVEGGQQTLERCDRYLTSKETP